MASSKDDSGRERVVAGLLDAPSLERFVKASERVALLDQRIGGGDRIVFNRSYGYFDHLADALCRTGLSSIDEVDAALRDRADDVVALAKEWVSRHAAPSAPLPSGISLRYLALLRVPLGRSPAEQRRLLVDLGYGEYVDDALALLGTSPPESPPAERSAGELGESPEYRRWLADARTGSYAVTVLRDGFAIDEALSYFRRNGRDMTTSGLVPVARGELEGVVALFLLSHEGPERGKCFFWWDEEAALLSEVAPSLDVLAEQLFERPPSGEWPWHLFV